MPELPDLTIYIENLEPRVVGEQLLNIRLASPFLLRSVTPAIHELQGKKVTGLRRIGKRIVFELEDNFYIVLHLMIAGRLHWKERGAKIGGKSNLAAFDFSSGTLFLTEAGTKKRVSLHLVRGRAGLTEFDRGGIEIFEASLETFRLALLRENHTIKRSLTDPRLFSAIGNAYSDEILHRAKLSPLKQTRQLNNDEVSRLYNATRETMQEWIRRLRDKAEKGFSGRVTAFHDEMAVHGRYGKPCPVCGSKIQRIVYAENECNYCARCQTGGKLLSDRSLARLLKDDWPKTIDELEAETLRGTISNE